MEFQGSIPYPGKGGSSFKGKISFKDRLVSEKRWRYARKGEGRLKLRRGDR